MQNKMAPSETGRGREKIKQKDLDMSNGKILWGSQAEALTHGDPHLNQSDLIS